MKSYECYDLPNQPNQMMATILEMIAVKMVMHRNLAEAKIVELMQVIFHRQSDNHFCKLISIENRFVGMIVYEIAGVEEKKEKIIIVDYLIVIPEEHLDLSGVDSLLLHEAILSANLYAKEGFLIVIFNPCAELIETYKRMGLLLLSEDYFE